MLSDFEGRVVVFSCRVAQKRYVSTTLDLHLNSTPGFCFLASILVKRKKYLAEFILKCSFKKEKKKKIPLGESKMFNEFSSQLFCGSNLELFGGVCVFFFFGYSFRNLEASGGR